jgi:large subunit ribosomal protein L25
MKKITLKAVLRGAPVTGKKMIKAELYGPGVANQHLSIEETELAKAISEARGATLIDLVVAGAEAIPVLVREIQRDPLKDSLVHVDLFAVDITKKVLVPVEVVPVGVSKAITQLGATLVKNLQTLKGECLPANMVSELKADISKMETAKDVVRVEDLTLPEGLVIKNSPRDVVFSLSASRKGRSEAGAAVEGAPVANGVATPEAAAKAPAKKEEKKKK